MSHFNASTVPSLSDLKALKAKAIAAEDKHFDLIGNPEAAKARARANQYATCCWDEYDKAIAERWLEIIAYKPETDKQYKYLADTRSRVEYRRMAEIQRKNSSGYGIEAYSPAVKTPDALFVVHAGENKQRPVEDVKHHPKYGPVGTRIYVEGIVQEVEGALLAYDGNQVGSRRDLYLKDDGGGIHWINEYRALEIRVVLYLKDDGGGIHWIHEDRTHEIRIVR